MNRTLPALIAVLALAAIGVACDDEQDDRSAASSPTPPVEDESTADHAADGQGPAGSVNPTVTRESVEAALSSIDGFVETEMEHFGVPGVAVSVVLDDEVVFSKGYGVRVVGEEDPITPETVFQIASLSKPLTATAVAGLVGKGIISWDDPVHDYNPDLQFSDPWVTEHITFADLYSHRSGLPGSFGNDLEHIGYSRDEILARLRLMPLSPFRDSYSYSNFGMTAAGDAAAKAAGMTFEDMVDEELFEPAGMTSSSTRFADLQDEADVSAIHVEIDGEWIVGPRRDPDPQAPAGGGVVVAERRHHMGPPRARRRHARRRGDHRPGGPRRDPRPPHRQGSLVQLRRQPGAVRARLEHRIRPPRLPALVALRRLLRRRRHDRRAAADRGPRGRRPDERDAQGIPEIIADEIIDEIATGGPTRDWREVWYDQRFAYFQRETGPEPDPDAEYEDDAYVGTYANDYYGEVQVVKQGDGLALLEGPDEYVVAISYVGDDVFSAVTYPETPAERTAITFTVVDGLATTVDIGDGGGPGTGLLTRQS